MRLCNRCLSCTLMREEAEEMQPHDDGPIPRSLRLALYVFYVLTVACVAVFLERL